MTAWLTLYQLAVTKPQKVSPMQVLRKERVMMQLGRKTMAETPSERLIRRQGLLDYGAVVANAVLVRLGAAHYPAAEKVAADESKGAGSALASGSSGHAGVSLPRE